jgi:hypothetical protein
MYLRQVQWTQHLILMLTKLHEVHIIVPTLNNEDNFLTQVSKDGREAMETNP